MPLLVAVGVQGTSVRARSDALGQPCGIGDRFPKNEHDAQDGQLIKQGPGQQPRVQFAGGECQKAGSGVRCAPLHGAAPSGSVGTGASADGPSSLSTTTSPALPSTTSAARRCAA